MANWLTQAIASGTVASELIYLACWFPSSEVEYLSERARGIYAVYAVWF
ncbi:hypothetical protein FHT09_004052 [Xanthomonas arboricola]|nr:hypothetical protein [Xanthomonas sp. CFBP 8152]